MASSNDHERRAPATDELPPGPDEGPRGPTDLAARSWRTAIRRTVVEFKQDNLSDWAAR